MGGGPRGVRGLRCVERLAIAEESSPPDLRCLQLHRRLRSGSRHRLWLDRCVRRSAVQADSRARPQSTSPTLERFPHVRTTGKRKLLSSRGKPRKQGKEVLNLLRVFVFSCLRGEFLHFDTSSTPHAPKTLCSSYGVVTSN